jgi:hypothetical protein
MPAELFPEKGGVQTVEGLRPPVQHMGAFVEVRLPFSDLVGDVSVTQPSRGPDKQLSLSTLRVDSVGRLSASSLHEGED